MIDGIILKALSGFYYVETADGLVSCKARGKFRKDKITPLVGDRVQISLTGGGTGILEQIIDRRNFFIRPAVANLDQMVIIASEVIPITDPFLIDRIMAIAETKDCEPIVCVNKSDSSDSRSLYDMYRKIGVHTILTSAVTGEGIDELAAAISGKVSAFTGNSGVGKSSILNALEPDFHIKVGEVSDKLGRGRHTTRHVELYRLSCGAIVADTPGFSSFDTERMELTSPSELQYAFREFEPYLNDCRFTNCAHIKEAGCAVTQAVKDGEIQQSRHNSYVRLYEQIKQINQWELKD